MVVGGWRPPHGVPASYVDVDNRGGARSAVEHLIAGGRRIIAHHQPARRTWPRASTGSRAIATPSPTPASTPTDDLVAVGDFTQDGGAAAMERLLAARPDIDAVFAASDLTAAGAHGRADGGRSPRPRGRRASPASTTRPSRSTLRPKLTSVRQPIEEMGHEMARQLIDLVEGSDPVPRRVILATQLIRRASSAGRRMP